MTEIQEKNQDHKHGIEIVKAKKKKKDNFTFASIVTKNDTLLGSSLFLDCMENI